MGITSQRKPLVLTRQTVTLSPGQSVAVVAEQPAPPVVVTNAVVCRWLTERRAQVLKLQSQPGCGMERKIKYAGQLKLMSELRKFITDTKRKR